MVSGYPKYYEIITKLRAILEGKGYTVVEVEPWKYSDAPLAIISPALIGFETIAQRDAFAYTAGIDITLILRETEPEDWFADVVSKLWAVVDAIIADATLGGTVKWIYPVTVAPGRISKAGERPPTKLYYGGLITLNAQRLYNIMGEY